MRRPSSVYRSAAASVDCLRFIRPAAIAARPPGDMGEILGRHRKDIGEIWGARLEIWGGYCGDTGKIWGRFWAPAWPAAAALARLPSALPSALTSVLPSARCLPAHSPSLRGRVAARVLITGRVRVTVTVRVRVRLRVGVRARVRVRAMGWGPCAPSLRRPLSPWRSDRAVPG